MQSMPISVCRCVSIFLIAFSSCRLEEGLCDWRNNKPLAQMLQRTELILQTSHLAFDLLEIRLWKAQARWSRKSSAVCKQSIVHCPRVGREWLSCLFYPQPVQFSRLAFPSCFHCHTVLKPGGRAAFSVWGRVENSPKFTIIPGVLKEFGISEPPRRSNFHLVCLFTSQSVTFYT